jgi:hypothetical protein
MTERSLHAWQVAAAALVVGSVVGAAGPALRHTLQPWRVGEFRVVDTADAGPLPRAEAVETRHAFGTVGVGSTGSHEFTVRNTGTAPLTLSRGATSCSCTVSDFETSEGGSPEARKVVAPGESTRIRVQWRGKGAGGPFRQQVTILTDDPRLPEIVFVVEGTVVPTWKAVPDAIVLSRVSASTGGRATADVFTFGREPPRVSTAAVEDSQVAQFLSLASEPLPEGVLAGESGATGGFRIVVDVKPGAPLGPLRATARVVFTMPEEVIAEIPVEGTVGGDLVLAGPGWDSSRQALLLGTVSRGEGLRTRVFLTVKGPHRDRVRPVVKEVIPESLRVTIGDGSPIGSGGAVRIPIDIEIPSGSRAVNHLCSQAGPAGRIVLDTGHPESPEFTIPVCVAIGP